MQAPRAERTASAPHAATSKRVEAELPHPFRLVLHLADLSDDLAIKPLATLEDVLVGRIVESVLILADARVGFEDGVGCHLI